MIVSRSDIITDHIVESNDPKRFLKLSPSNYLKMLKIDPCAPQIAMVNAINNPKYRFVTAAVSRRVGKTYISNIVGQLVFLVPNSHVLIMSPNYSLSQISFDLQRSLIRHFEIEVKRDNAKDKIIELPNGSTIRLGSVNNVDSCVGRSYDLIIFDEAALTNGSDAFNIALRPTLDKPNSKALFISTPRGRTNWFHGLYQRGFSEDYPEWCSIHATYQDNPRASQDDIDEAKLTMSEAEFRQEYEADFNTYEGRIYNFNFDECVRDLSELDRSKMDIIGGLDHGYNDPTAMAVVAYDWDTEMYYVIDEYFGQASTDVLAANIRKQMNKYDMDFLYVDHAAAQFRADLAELHDITTINAKKSVLDGIAFIGSLIDNNRLIVDQRCTNILRALEAYQWDPNPNLIREKPKHDFSDAADALRYALYSFVVGSGTF